MKIRLLGSLLAFTLLLGNSGIAAKIDKTKLPDDVRAQQVKDMKWGMFICWSFSTFYGSEWTPTKDKDAGYFKATGCDTDQWCETAKAAGMGYILFLSKHHDGFCLWDTATTEKKVTNSPLGIDVLAKLRKSCDKYDIKLALYFSEGDWNWPESKDGKGGNGGGINPEVKKAQLKELLTQYGPIEFWWMDHATGTGGLPHKETVEWMHKFQPNTFVGFNHGTPAGRLCLREMGRPGKLGDANATKYNKDHATHTGFLVAEFTYPILPKHRGGAMWFYSLPKHDNLCHSAEKLYRDYLGAQKHQNIFSIDVGPNYAGRIRDIDVKTLTQVGEMIKKGPTAAFGTPDYIKGAKATASSEWNSDYSAAAAVDGDSHTRWGAESDSRSGWLQLDLGKDQTVGAVRVDETSFPRTQEFAIEYKTGGEWKTLHKGTTINGIREYKFTPVTARYVRLNIIKASEVPTIEEFQVCSPKKK